MKLNGESQLRCPKCDRELVPGEAKVRGNLYTFLSAGVSIQHLWFKPQDGSCKAKVALESYETTSAYFCQACKLLTIDVKDSQLARE